MTKIQREQLRVEKLNKICLMIPAINKILEKAEPYIKAYNKALKNYWENGRNKNEFQKNLVESDIMKAHSLYPDDRRLDYWNYDLGQLDKCYRQSLKI